MPDKPVLATRLQALALVVGCIVVAVGVAALTLTRPTKYRAIEQIQIAGVDDTASPAVAKNAADDLSSVILSAAFRTNVSKLVGVSSGQLNRGLQVGQVGQTNLAQITFTGPKDDQPGKVVAAVAQVASQEYVSPQVILLQKQVTLFQAIDTQAATKVAALYQVTHVLNPDDAYHTLSAEVADLQTALVEGGPSTSGLPAAIRRQQSALAVLATQAMQYDNLTAIKAQDDGLVSQAQMRLVEAQASQQTVGPLTENDPEGVPIGRAKTVGQAAALGAALVFVIGGALIVGYNDRRRSRASVKATRNMPGHSARGASDTVAGQPSGSPA